MIHSKKTSGFTLLELGLVLVILSLLASGILSIATQNVRTAKKKELEMKMDVIEDAILSYRKANGFIPCPSQITLAETETNFGYPAVNAGSCADGDESDLNPVIRAAFSSGNVRIGAVPVRALGLSDEYAFDPWGGKFRYVVDYRVTLASSFNPTALTDTTFGSITVEDESGNQLTTTAVLLLLSHGPNGHGAHQRSGTRKYVGSSSASEQQNCDCNTSAPETENAIYRMHKPSAAVASETTFDDVVRYYSRTQLFSTDDITTENK